MTTVFRVDGVDISGSSTLLEHRFCASAHLVMVLDITVDILCHLASGNRRNISRSKMCQGRVCRIDP